VKKRRLFWDGEKGYARCGEVFVRLTQAPMVEGVEEEEMIAFNPEKRVAGLIPKGKPARRMREEEIQAVLKMLERMEAGAMDAIEGGSTIVVLLR
jgi:hypothetical protein